MPLSSLLVLRLSDLPAYTMFGVRVAAETSAGLGPYSPAEMARTREGGKSG